MTSWQAGDSAAEAPTLRFVVTGPPVPKGRPRLGRGGRVYTPAATEAYEKHVGTIATAEVSRVRGWRADWAAYAVTIGVYRSAARGDIDNYTKAILDGLNGIVWADDAAVTRLAVDMSTDADRPRVEVTVGMLGDKAKPPAKPRKRTTKKASAPGLALPSLTVPWLESLLRESAPKRRGRRRRKPRA